jgi:hypothetical protein
MQAAMKAAVVKNVECVTFLARVLLQLSGCPGAHTKTGAERFQTLTTKGGSSCPQSKLKPLRMVVVPQGVVILLVDACSLHTPAAAVQTLTTEGGSSCPQSKLKPLGGP